MSAYLDTHVAVWLHDGLVERLSAAAKREIENNDLLISPMVLLEFQYLRERKRIRVDAGELYAYLNATFGIGLCTVPFPAVAQEALSVTWTADPFDRIIVAQAQSNRAAPLVTADVQIRRNYERAVW
ncbi:MAG: type II toxin-antitoxin system VapC family toxin [Acidobacteriia bacterium]|nr:type II toxin-antitoxin system VapC family toxin [Terriglobia bacterium]